MAERKTEKQKKNELSELELKVQQADPVVQHAIAEYKKEISRLQKQLAKEQVQKESEIARLTAECEEKVRSAPQITIQRRIIESKHDTDPQS